MFNASLVRNRTSRYIFHASRELGTVVTARARKVVVRTFVHQSPITLRGRLIRRGPR